MQAFFRQVATRIHAPKMRDFYAFLNGAVAAVHARRSNTSDAIDDNEEDDDSANKNRFVVTKYKYKKDHTHNYRKKSLMHSVMWRCHRYFGHHHDVISNTCVGLMISFFACSVLEEEADAVVAAACVHVTTSNDKI